MSTADEQPRTRWGHERTPTPDPADAMGAADEQPRTRLVGRMREFAGAAIFARMSALAERTGAVNLGQGFPDVDGPKEVSEAAVAAIRSGRYNQYPPGIGHAELRRAVADHQRRFWGLEFDPDTEVLVTAGATEAITAAVLALAGPGDEVVTFEPYFDIYPADIAMAGARRRVVTLRPPAYSFDAGELAAAFGPRTKALILNSPHNPTGRVFTVEELDTIARLCLEHDVIAVTDEVYEHLTFDGRVHTPLATRPGMADRTITVSSAGKTLSFTGWKIGWACGQPELVSAVQATKQLLTYVNGGPFQPAVAEGLRLGDGFFDALAADLQAKRDLLCDGLASAGFDPIVPQGAYYITADIRPLGLDAADGMEFCLSLPERCGVAAVPCQVFYDDPAAGASLVRFAACKQPGVLHEAIRRLRTLKPS